MEGVNDLTEKLNGIWQEISTKLYQQTEEENQQNPQDANEATDVEFEEVK